MAPPDSDAGAIDADRRRDGRGRLSTIDTLPEDADEDIAWANEQLRDRKMPQNEILREFNARLADKGIKSVTKSAFSRYSVRRAIELRKMEASRQITSLIMDRLPKGERSESMIAATELLKYRVLEAVMADDEPDPKSLATATLALARLSATAAREDEVKRKEQKEQREQAARDAEAARLAREKADADMAAEVDRIANEAGMSEQWATNLRNGLLGLA